VRDLVHSCRETYLYSDDSSFQSSKKGFERQHYNSSFSRLDAREGRRPAMDEFHPFGKHLWLTSQWCCNRCQPYGWLSPAYL
jgi:hypothetical protein